MQTFARSLFTTLLLALFTLTAAAQVGRIQESTITEDKQRVDALSVIVQPERKDMQKAFDDWMDDRYNINMKGGGLFANKRTRNAEDVIIPAIDADPITFMTRTETVGEETRMYIYASRNGNFIDRADYKAFTGMENIFDSFLSSYLPEYYEERVEEAREELEDLRDELADAEEDFADNEEKIAKLQKENRKLEDKQANLRQQIADAEKAVTRRQEMRTEVQRELRDVSREPRRNRRNK